MHFSPKTVNDGLVFHYDTGNTVRSYKGEPTTNKAGNVHLGFNGGRWAKRTEYPQKGALPFKLLGDVYQITNGNNYWGFAGDFSIAYNKTYTLSYWYYLSTDSNVGQWNNSFFGVPAGGGSSYTTVSTKSNNTFSTVGTDTWRYGSANLTTNIAVDSYTYFRGTYTAGASWDALPTGQVYIANFQLEENPHATPYTTGTRSVTQGLLNLAGPQTIDLTNASFDADAQIRFDGTSDYLNVGDNFGFDSPNFSFGALFYWDGDPKDGAIIAKRNDSPYNQYNLGISNDAQYGGEGSKIYVAIVPDGGGGATYGFFNYDLAPFGAGWYHALVTVDTTVQKLYVNGVNVGTNTKDYTGKTFRMTGNNLYVGAVNLNANPGKFFLGSIPIAHIYSRALTADEVKRNFTAIRSRFNI